MINSSQLLTSLFLHHSINPVIAKNNATPVQSSALVQGIKTPTHNLFSGSGFFFLRHTTLQQKNQMALVGFKIETSSHSTSAPHKLCSALVVRASLYYKGIHILHRLQHQQINTDNLKYRIDTK